MERTVEVWWREEGEAFFQERLKHWQEASLTTLEAVNRSVTDTAESYNAWVVRQERASQVPEH